jgi:SAM-dependent methyltransferase
MTAGLARGLQRVAGLDASPEMLRIARDRDPGIEWIVGDMRSPPVDGSFDLVISCSALQHLITDDDLARAFHAVRRLLAEDGTFAFDVYQPDLDYLGIDRTDRLARSVTDGDGRHLEVREDMRYDAESRVLTVDWRLVEEGQPDLTLAQTSYRMRQYFPADLERVLNAASLAIRDRYGDFDRSGFTADSKHQVLVCSPL